MVRGPWSAPLISADRRCAERSLVKGDGGPFARYVVMSLCVDDVDVQRHVGSGGGSVLGPTLRSSQRFIAAASSHTVVMRSSAFADCIHAARANVFPHVRPFIRSSSTRGWSFG